MDASYWFGVEEEYFLTDAISRGTPRRTVKASHDAAQVRQPRAEGELLQSQIEVSTPPSTTFAEARGLGGREALGAVVDWLAATTARHRPT